MHIHIDLHIFICMYTYLGGRASDNGMWVAKRLESGYLFHESP